MGSVRVPGVVRWCEIRIAPSRHSVLSTFRAFFAGDTRKLMKRFRAYKLYDQHEAMMPISDPDT